MLGNIDSRRDFQVSLLRVEKERTKNAKIFCITLFCLAVLAVGVTLHLMAEKSRVYHWVLIGNGSSLTFFYGMGALLAWRKRNHSYHWGTNSALQTKVATWNCGTIDDFLKVRLIPRLHQLMKEVVREGSLDAQHRFFEKIRSDSFFHPVGPTIAHILAEEVGFNRIFNSFSETLNAEMYDKYLKLCYLEKGYHDEILKLHKYYLQRAFDALTSENDILFLQEIVGTGRNHLTERDIQEMLGDEFEVRSDKHDTLIAVRKSCFTFNSHRALTVHGETCALSAVVMHKQTSTPFFLGSAHLPGVNPNRTKEQIKIEAQAGNAVLSHLCSSSSNGVHIIGMDANVTREKDYDRLAITQQHGYQLDPSSKKRPTYISPTGVKTELGFIAAKGSPFSYTVINTQNERPALALECAQMPSDHAPKEVAVMIVKGAPTLFHIVLDLLY